MPSAHSPKTVVHVTVHLISGQTMEFHSWAGSLLDCVEGDSLSAPMIIHTGDRWAECGTAAANKERIAGIMFKAVAVRAVSGAYQDRLTSGDTP